MRIRNFTRLGALTLALTIALAVPALAQQVGEDVYQGPAAQQQAEIGGVAPAEQAPATTSASAGGGALPFTGFEIGLAAALGITLLGVGFLLRRTSRADSGS